MSNLEDSNLSPNPELCPHCGQPIEPGKAYCAHCGMALRNSGIWPPLAAPGEQPILSRWPRLDLPLGIIACWITLSLFAAMGSVTQMPSISLAGIVVMIAAYFWLRRRRHRFALGLLIGLPIAVVVSVVVFALEVLGAFVDCVHQFTHQYG